MSLRAKVLALVLVVALMSVFCVTPVCAAPSDNIATSITLDATIRDQRPDGYMFQSSAPGLIQGMVNGTLGSDGTPVLNQKGWYKSDLAEGADVSTAVPDTSKDYSKASDFGFGVADFYRWYHTCSQDPIGDIMKNTQAVLKNSKDPNEKLYAICFAKYAVGLASDDCLKDYDASIKQGDGDNAKKIYPATEICNEIDNLLTLLSNAANGSISLGDFATDEIISDFNNIYGEYKEGDDLNTFFDAQFKKIDTSKCNDVRLNTALKQNLVLKSDGELKTFSDKTMGYIYSYDSSVNPMGSSANEAGYFPIDNLGFGNYKDDGVAEGNNYHFTMTFENNFIYHGGEVFTFSGDDDVWVYINNKLVLDIGGVHSAITGVINLDDIAKQQGFKVGDVCKLNFFFAERMTRGSNLKISTSIQFVPDDYIYVVVDPNGPSNGNPTTGIENIVPIVAVVAAVAILGTVSLTIISKKRKKTNK